MTYVLLDVGNKRLFYSLKALLNARKMSNFHSNKLRSSEAMLSCPNLKCKFCCSLYKELYILSHAYLVVERKKRKESIFLQLFVFSDICM